MAGRIAAVRSQPLALVAAALVAAEAALHTIVRGAYPGATALLVLACGLALVPLLPSELGRPSLWLAAVPALGIASFAIGLTTASILGIPLNGTSIRAAAASIVVAGITAIALLRPTATTAPWNVRGELSVALGLAGLVAVAFASSWDVAYPLQVVGTDVGHYLLYAEEVAEQQRILADDPLAGEPRLFADPPAVGAVYASLLVLDGVSSWTLGSGLLVFSAISVLGVFAAAAALWGLPAGLVAAGAYSVAPIRLDPMYWHGLGTTLALVFLPFVVLALGLMFRGSRDWRTIALLAVSLVGVAVSHSTTAVVVAVFVLLAPLIDLIRRFVGRPGERSVRAWWRWGVVRPVLLATGSSVVLGLGVIAHLRAQAVDLGRPVDVRFLGPDWFDRAVIADYYSWRFLALVAVATVLVLSSRRLRGDSALLSIGALALACIVVNESHRIGFPFEYRRVVYPLGIALALLLGVAFLRFRPRPAWVGAWFLVLLAVAQLSIGLRLPQRVIEGAGPEPLSLVVLREFREQLEEGRLPEAETLVTDACLQFAVPYVVRRPTLPAYGERQVGFESRLRLARQAAVILRGGAEGKALARQLGVDYAVVDPSCSPGVSQRLDGSSVLGNDEVDVVLIPSTREAR